MKRLLLSTALILGTLSGVNGADAAIEALTPRQARQAMLSELDTHAPAYATIQKHQVTLKSPLVTTSEIIFFNTQITVDNFLSDLVKQATFSWPRFETTMVLLCILSHLYVHWISDDPTKIASNDKSRIAVPITSALTVKALDSARKIWNDYQKSSATNLQGWKAKLQDHNNKYHISFLLACVFIANKHTSEGVIKVKLQEIFSTARNFASIDGMLP